MNFSLRAYASASVPIWGNRSWLLAEGQTAGAVTLSQRLRPRSIAASAIVSVKDIAKTNVCVVQACLNSSQ